MAPRKATKAPARKPPAKAAPKKAINAKASKGHAINAQAKAQAIKAIVAKAEATKVVKVLKAKSKARKSKPVQAGGTITKANRTPATKVWPPEKPRVQAVLRGLDKMYPDANCELHHNTPFELLIATILSAQCTDERVNKVTPRLFQMFPNPQTMAEAPPEVLEDLVKSTGFFRQKAKNIRATANILTDKYKGALPRTLDELKALPGVARKTANVVLGSAFGIAAGIVVDTHVQRLAMRLGLTRNLSPEKIERDLMEVIPKDHWIILSHQMIWHGRRMCTARKPACEGCIMAPHCPGAFQESA